MAGSSGFSISITAKDATAGPLDAINKRLAKLAAPAERFNKSLAKFNDVSGLARVTEGIRSLGAGAADAFRSLDRMASPLAAITGAGSIAGLAALTRRWAEFGNTLGQTSYRLNMPVEQLSVLRGAMRLAGGSAADLDRGMQGLSDTINAAAWGRDAGAMQMFKTLGISVRDANGHIRSTVDVLGDVAEKIQGMPAATQSRILAILGMGDGFLPLLKDGRQGLLDWEKQAQQTGGVMSHDMVEHASAMNKAFQELGLVIEGVGNRLVDKWAPQVTSTLESISHWIEKNKELTDSIAEIGAGIMALAALKPVGWVMRLLGLGAVAGAATKALPLLLTGPAGGVDPEFSEQKNAEYLKNRDAPGPITQWLRDHFGLSQPNQPPGGVDPNANQPGSGAPTSTGGILREWWRNHAPSWAPGTGGPIVPSPGSPTEQRGIRNRNPLNLGYVPDQPGVLGRESGNNHQFGVYPDMATGIAAELRQLKMYQDSGIKTVHQMVDRWVSDPKFDSTGYVRDVAREIGVGPDQPFDISDPKNAAAYIRAAAKHESGAVSEADIARGVEMWRGRTTAAADPTASGNGHVHVEVTLKGAPPGTIARTTTSGAVTASAPQIGTSMPMVN